MKINTRKIFQLIIDCLDDYGERLSDGISLDLPFEYRKDITNSDKREIIKYYHTTNGDPEEIEDYKYGDELQGDCVIFALKWWLKDLIDD